MSMRSASLAARGGALSLLLLSGWVGYLLGATRILDVLRELVPRRPDVAGSSHRLSLATGGVCCRGARVVVEELAHVDILIHSFDLFCDYVLQAKIESPELSAVVRHLFSKDFNIIIIYRLGLLLLHLLAQLLDVFVAQHFLDVIDDEVQGLSLDRLVIVLLR